MGNQFILRLQTDRRLGIFLNLASGLIEHPDIEISTQIPDQDNKATIEFQLNDLAENANQRLLGTILTTQGSDTAREIVVTLSLSSIRSGLNFSDSALLPPLALSGPEEAYLYYAWILGGRLDEEEIQDVLESTRLEIIIIPPNTARNSLRVQRHTIPFLDFVTRASGWRYIIPYDTAE